MVFALVPPLAERIHLLAIGETQVYGVPLTHRVVVSVPFPANLSGSSDSWLTAATGMIGVCEALVSWSRAPTTTRKFAGPDCVST